MVTYLIIVGLMVLLGGRTTRSMTVIPSDNSSTKLTVSDEPKKLNGDLTDQAIRNVLIEIINRKFRSDDSYLISLIKKGIVDAAMSKPWASIEAGGKKAQRFITDVTAAYTQAIFRANTAQEAQQILLRFQDTIHRIVHYTKNGEFRS